MLNRRRRLMWRLPFSVIHLVLQLSCRLMNLQRFLFIILCCMSFTTNCLSQSRARSARHKVLGHNGEILAYSDSFDPILHYDELPDGLKELLRAYAVQPKRHANRMKGNFVPPLLQSTRHQEAPYNGSAPFYKYDDGTLNEDRCPTGCVATALEQVVSYWRHPSELKDTLHGWETDHYVIPDVLPGTMIDWDNIKINYADGNYNSAQAKAIADLTYYLGVAVHMNWTPGSGGANLFRAMDPLYDAFDYRTVAFVQRGLYSSPAWNRMLRHELECGRPIVYTGHSFTLNGHCFNIDGVDEDGYYHANWGEGDMTLYIDLDYMNPFEPIDEPTLNGMFTGMFSNQTALFMHPDDFEIDIWDTLSVDDALHGVEIDDVTFSRDPDVKAYVRADFSMTNRTADSLNYTFEVFTYLPTDTAIFQQADFVGLSTVNLAPGEHKIWPVFCRFNEEGDRIFACSPDDESMPYSKQIHIGKGVSPNYVFGSPEYKILRQKDADGAEDLVLRVSFDVSNRAQGGGTAESYTYCLFEGDSNEDVRHFNIIQVMAGDTYHEVVEFHHLKKGMRYRYLTRMPWIIRHDFSFEIREEDIVDGISEVLPANGLPTSGYYDLQGRQHSSIPHGIYIHNGKKINFIK